MVKITNVIKPKKLKYKDEYKQLKKNKNSKEPLLYDNFIEEEEKPKKKKKKKKNSDKNLTQKLTKKEKELKKAREEIKRLHKKKKKKKKKEKNDLEKSKERVSSKKNKNSDPDHIPNIDFNIMVDDEVYETVEFVVNESKRALKSFIKDGISNLRGRRK